MKKPPEEDKRDPEYQRELYRDTLELYLAYKEAGYPFGMSAQGMMPILDRPGG